MARLGSRRAAVVASALPVLLARAAASAHGGHADAPGGIADVLLAWSFDPLLQVSLPAALLAYLRAVRHVNAAHRGNRVPRGRVAASVAGIVVLEVALALRSSATTPRSSACTWSSTCC